MRMKVNLYCFENTNNNVSRSKPVLRIKPKRFGFTNFFQCFLSHPSQRVKKNIVDFMTRDSIGFHCCDHAA